jgi:hypothetical protein
VTFSFPLPLLPVRSKADISYCVARTLRRLSLSCCVPSHCIARALHASSLARRVAVLIRASLSLHCVHPSHVIPLSLCRHSHSHAPLIALSAPFMHCPSLVVLPFSFVCRSCHAACALRVSSILMTFSFACCSRRVACALHASSILMMFSFTRHSRRIACALHASSILMTFSFTHHSRCVACALHALSILMTFSFALLLHCVRPSRIVPLLLCHRSRSRVPLIALPMPFAPCPSLGHVAVRIHVSPLIVLPVPFACHPSLVVLPFLFAHPLIVLPSHVVPLSSCHCSPSCFALIALPFM